MSGQQVGYKHFWPIAVLAATGFLFTTIIALFIQQAEQSRLKAEFVHTSMDELLAMRTNLARHLDLLTATAAFYQAAPTATPQDLSAFVKPLLLSRPGIEQVEWLSRAAEQRLYTYARYNDQPVLIREAQQENQEGRLALQILQPILFTPTTTITSSWVFTPDAGFVSIGLRVDQVIAGTLHKTGADDIHFDLYDIAQKKLLYHYPPQGTGAHARPTFVAATQSSAQAFLVKEEFTILGRQWLVVLQPTAAYFSQNQPWFHWLIVISSLILTGCLVTYLSVLLNRQKQSERDLHERTEQLRQANQRLQETLQELQFQKTLLECTSEAAQDGVLVVSPARKWLLFNRKFLEMWQIPPALAAQRSSHEALRWALTQVQDAPHVKERMETLYAQPDDYATLEVRFKNGTILECFSAPVKSADGAHFGRVWYYHDITQRKRTEEALRQSEARNRAFVNAIPDLLFRVKRDGTFLDYHSAPGYLPVMPPEQFLGRNAADVFAQPVAQALKERITHVLSTGEIKVIEYDMPMLNGEMRSWEQRMVMLSEDEVMLIIRDITARKQAEAALRLSQQQLHERQQREKELVEEELARLRNQLVISTRFATLGQVAATIAHELRNPLGAVRNAVYYIRRYLVQDHQELLDFLQIVDMEVTTADRIITDLLEMTRAKEPGIQQLDLCVIAQEIWRRSKQTDQIVFHCSVPHEPFWVFADPTQFRQVLANLMTNAIQAMPDGGALSMTGEEQPDYVMITVQDSGSGVPAAVRERIFEPLFTTKAKGTGLGLAICRQIIERHGGAIELVDSSQGAKFVIRLPVKPVATMAPIPS
ncbi:MAG: PAS domain S-box protein [Caldilinea sp. CFX5]|nr:PAS domain S-box protein [Caldilinea sp. CFX5]